MQMKQAQLAVLAAHQRDTARSTALGRGVIMGGSLFAVAFVAFALLMIRRDHAGRSRAEDELGHFFDVSVDLFVIADDGGLFPARESRDCRGARLPASKKPCASPSWT